MSVTTPAISTDLNFSPLPELAIGNVPIGFPVVQAALSGYSDMAMRVIARRLGAPYALCEVILDQFVNEGSRKLARRWQVSDEEHPVGGQLMGSDPVAFAEAARDMAAAGFDVIDINFGCPVRKVLGRCRGGYHLSQPEVALEIVRRVRDAVPAAIPVTVNVARSPEEAERQARGEAATAAEGAEEETLEDQLAAELAGQGGGEAERPRG